jgi:molybdopterin-guanine dinucleotide biosynthesis protein A
MLQVSQIIIVANRHQALYATYGYPVIADKLADYQGPLAGVAAGLAAIETSHALFVPADAARLPTNLAAELAKAHVDHGGPPAFVRSADRVIANCCLLAAKERTSVDAALAAGKRELADWLKARDAAPVDFSNWPAEFWGVESPAGMPALEKALLR